MSKIKRSVSVLMAVLMIGSMAAPATAHEAARKPQGYVPIVALWQNLQQVQATISASGRTVSPRVTATATNSSQRITGTMFLERQSGTRWVSVASWSVSGTGRLVETRHVTGTAGGTYRTRVVVTAGSDRVERISSSVRV